MVNLPLINQRHLSIGAGVSGQPAVDMLGGGDAVGLFSPHPPLTRHQGGDGGGVGEQDLSPVCQGDLGLVGADGSDLHGGVPQEQT